MIFLTLHRQKELGKPVGNDLINGNLTLPALLALDDPDYINQLKRSLRARKENKKKSNN